MVRKKMEFLVHIRRWNYTITDHWSGERQASEKTAISTSVGATGVGECEKQGAACIRKRAYGISHRIIYARLLSFWRSFSIALYSTTRSTHMSFPPSLRSAYVRVSWSQASLVLVSSLSCHAYIFRISKVDRNSLPGSTAIVRRKGIVGKARRQADGPLDAEREGPANAASDFQPV